MLDYEIRDTGKGWYEVWVGGIFVIRFRSLARAVESYPEARFVLCDEGYTLAVNGEVCDARR